jgi:hypothetical protein
MESSPKNKIEQQIRSHIAKFDRQILRDNFLKTDEFIRIPDFLPASITNQLLEILPEVEPYVHRSYLPRHKSGGSVSRFNLEKSAPIFTEIYFSTSHLDLFSQITNKKLLTCPPNDSHAYALYLYTRKGDHIGFHYDTSYYSQARYTALVGLQDNSSCRLECELFTRIKGAKTVMQSVKLMPGELVLFNGDKVRHRVTPCGANERRVALTMEYVTSTKMSPYLRFVSDMKDAIAYFGFAELWKRLIRRKQ